MNCKFYDPITAACAPSCIVCSHYNRCSKEKATDGVFEPISGNAKDLKRKGENNYARE